MEQHGGAVLAGAINKYCFISMRELEQDFGSPFRIRYSVTENVDAVSKIDHPAVRELLEIYKVPGPIELNHMTDLPSRSGMGSSSAFVVGLSSILEKSKGAEKENLELAKLAIAIEQNALKENIGYQDAITTALGGFNLISFTKESHEFTISSLAQSRVFLDELAKNMVLVHVPKQRIASQVAAHQILEMKDHASELNELAGIAESAYQKILGNSMTIQEVGRLLHYSWEIKKKQSKFISNDEIDLLCAEIMRFGAYGVKLLGAGAGGFLLTVLPEGTLSAFREKFALQRITQFNWDYSGNRLYRIAE